MDSSSLAVAIMARLKELDQNIIAIEQALGEIEYIQIFEMLGDLTSMLKEKLNYVQENQIKEYEKLSSAAIIANQDFNEIVDNITDMQTLISNVRNKLDKTYEKIHMLR